MPALRVAESEVSLAIPACPRIASKSDTALQTTCHAHQWIQLTGVDSTDVLEGSQRATRASGQVSARKSLSLLACPTLVGQGPPSASRRSLRSSPSIHNKPGPLTKLVIPVLQQSSRITRSIRSAARTALDSAQNTLRRRGREGTAGGVASRRSWQLRLLQQHRQHSSSQHNHNTQQTHSGQTRSSPTAGPPAAAGTPRTRQPRPSPLSSTTFLRLPPLQTSPRSLLQPQ